MDNAFNMAREAIFDGLKKSLDNIPNNPEDFSPEANAEFVKSFVEVVDQFSNTLAGLYGLEIEYETTDLDKLPELSKPVTGR